MLRPLAGRLAREREPDQRVGGDHRREDDPGELLAGRVADRRDREGRDRGADVAHPVDAERVALALLREPLGDEGDADREGGAGGAEQEAGAEQGRVAGGEADEDAGPRRVGEHHPEEDPAAEAIGHHAEGNPQQRAEDDRDRDHHRRFGVGEAEVVLELRRERRQHAPGREAQGEGDRRQDQVSIRVACHELTSVRAGAGRRRPPPRRRAGHAAPVGDRAAAEVVDGDAPGVDEAAEGPQRVEEPHRRPRGSGRSGVTPSPVISSGFGSKTSTWRK